MLTGYFYNVNQAEGSRAWKNGTYFKFKSISVQIKPNSINLSVVFEG